MGPAEVREHCAVDGAGKSLLRAAMQAHQSGSADERAGVPSHIEAGAHDRRPGREPPHRGPARRRGDPVPATADALILPRARCAIDECLERRQRMSTSISIHDIDDETAARQGTMAVRAILLDTNAYAAFKRSSPDAIEIIRRAPVIVANPIVLGIVGLMALPLVVTLLCGLRHLAPVRAVSEPAPVARASGVPARS
jgi:hypothetical protein